MDDRTSSASAHTAQRADFRRDVVHRDGTCVITGAPPDICQACHIVPHYKGDEVCPNVSRSFQALFQSKYMINLSNYRQESYLEGINDTRNGLLLYSGFHKSFGESRIAFLRVSYLCIQIVFVGLNSFLDS